MRGRGFELAELTEKLHDKGIERDVPMHSRYLSTSADGRRRKGKKSSSCRKYKTDTYGIA